MSVTCKVPELKFGEFELNSFYKKYSFKDIFLFSTGKNIKQNEASPEFETPCIRYGELYHMYGEIIFEVINKTNLDKSELVFSNGNEILLPSAGEDPLDIGSASALTIENVAIGRTINILSPITDNFYNQIYVSYYINQKLRKKISTLAKGVSISNVYNSDLKKLEMILPNLEEQKKIASFLSSVDGRIEQLTKKEQLLREYKKGVMQKIFSQELRFKDDDGSEFPEWVEKKLGDIGITYNGLTGKTSENFGSGKPYIQYKQIFDNARISINGFGYVFIEPNEKQNKAQFGDIFFTTSSETPNEVGFASVLLDDIKEVYLNSFCFGYRVKSLDILNPYFAKFLFRSANFRRKVIKLAQGSTRYNISKIALMKIFIQLPSLEEQTKIANFLCSLDTKIEQVSKELKLTKEFKKALLQKMFV